MQLYGTALMLFVTIVLVRRVGRRGHDGEVFALFLIAYGAERLLLAPFRMEALASMKVFSVLFIAAGLIGLARIHLKRVASSQAKYPFPEENAAERSA